MQRAVDDGPGLTIFFIHVDQRAGNVVRHLQLAAYIEMSSPVMGSGADHQSVCEFSDKRALQFDGHIDYESHREHGSMWCNLTTLPLKQIALKALDAFNLKPKSPTTWKSFETSIKCYVIVEM